MAFSKANAYHYAPYHSHLGSNLYGVQRKPTSELKWADGYEYASKIDGKRKRREAITMADPKPEPTGWVQPYTISATLIVEM